MLSLTALGALCLLAAAIAAIVSAFLEDMHLSIAAHMAVVVLSSGALQCFDEPVLAAAALVTGVSASLAALAFLLATDASAGQRGRRRVQLGAGLAIPAVVWIALQIDTQASVDDGGSSRGHNAVTTPAPHHNDLTGLALFVAGSVVFALTLVAPVAMRRRQ